MFSLFMREDEEYNLCKNEFLKIAQENKKITENSATSLNHKKNLMTWNKMFTHTHTHVIAQKCIIMEGNL